MRSAQRSSLAMDDPPDPAEAERRLARGFANDDDERHGDRDDDPHRALGKSQPRDDAHAAPARRGSVGCFSSNASTRPASAATASISAGPSWRATAMSRRRTTSAVTSAKPSMGQRLPSPPAPA